VRVPTDAPRSSIPPRSGAGPAMGAPTHGHSLQRDSAADTAAPLLGILATYMDDGTISRQGFHELARAVGGRYETRGGRHLVRNAVGRVILAAVDPGKPRDRAATPVTPCATCGASPVGTFWLPATSDADPGPRYECGPHPPLFKGRIARGGRKSRNRGEHLSTARQPRTGGARIQPPLGIER
jgi:hypothetical protein